MKTKNDDMATKLEITVQKTTEAIARIQRFVIKYGSDLNNNQIERISKILHKLQEKVCSLDKNMNKNLIAHCGMNCGLCLHYLRANNKCPGCSSGRKVNGGCIKCAIKLYKERKGEYCFNCDKFPCERLKRMDKRYQEKYGMSEIANLETIKERGIESLLRQEEEKWVNSDGTYCVHDKKRYK